jgi:DNA gyrase subunit A
MFFTDKGKCYWKKVYEIPEGGRAARGRSLQNLVEKEKDEKITAFVTVKEFVDTKNIVMVTQNGTIKKTVLSAYSNVRRGGINALTIAPGDKLIEVKLTDGDNDIIIGTKKGMAIRFNEKEVRPMGRTATGVRGIKLSKDDIVIGLIVVKSSSTLLVVTDKGYGKRSSIDDYRITHRGGKGVITIRTGEKTGNLISMKEINDNDELVIITNGGMVIRLGVKKIRVMGRATQGVKLVNLKEGDSIADVARVISDDSNSDKDKTEDENSLI